MDLDTFWLCLHCDIDIKDMILGQGDDPLFGHWKQLCEIFSRSDKGVTFFKVKTHPSVVDNNCVKYYPDLAGTC